jgi:hypothetical protein
MITSDGSYKSWRDMTPAERQQDQQRHFPTLLARWRGAQATMWELTTSHKTLTIRLERAGSSDRLDISCYPVHIHGPVTWNNCEIQISPTERGLWTIKDAAAGLEVVGEGVEVAEILQPPSIGS